MRDRSLWNGSFVRWKARWLVRKHLKALLPQSGLVEISFKIKLPFADLPQRTSRPPLRGIPERRYCESKMPVAKPTMILMLTAVPPYQRPRSGQAPRASAEVAQDGLVPGCPTTSQAGPELLGFSVEISNQLVWFESLLCIKVGVQVRSSWSESKSRSAGWPNNGH